MSISQNRIARCSTTDSNEEGEASLSNLQWRRNGVQGVCGSYVLSTGDQEAKCFVFKPRSEEVSEIPFDGLLRGDFVKKETAAYVLDQVTHFHRVPETKPGCFIFHQDGRAEMVPVEHKHPAEESSQLQFGSQQAFINNASGLEQDCACVSVDPVELQKIAILDCRLANLDRNIGNMLRDNETGALYPIDHSYCLPHFQAGMGFAWIWEWCGMDAARVSFSEDNLNFIQQLQPLRDAQLLESVGIRKEECLSSVISTCILQKAVQVMGSRVASDKSDKQNSASPFALYNLYCGGIFDGVVRIVEEKIPYDANWTWDSSEMKSYVQLVLAAVEQVMQSRA